MRRFMAILVLALASQSAQAAGILIPKEKEVPPLAMLSHHVSVTIEDQVAITRVEQTFRNHTSNQLEATYIFPVPKEAGTTKFSMWVGGKEVKGEVLEAKQARDLYQSMVKQTLDPGLLEYMDHNLLKIRVYPVPAHGEVKVAFSYTSVAPKEDNLVLYTYPLKTDGKTIATLEKHSVKVSVKSQQPLHNIYSPSHSVSIVRPNDKQAEVLFEKDAASLDRNFQLYYATGTKDVGLTALTHRPEAGQKGHFMLLLSPRAELSKEQQVPRDIIFVLDTSGSMKGKRIVQAKNALNYCLGNLNKEDRFAVIHFATGVTKYSEKWLNADADNVIPAKKWVSNLETTGGTAINLALQTALDMRPNEPGRTFNIVFFTDGRPTVGETNADKILKNVLARNSASTRIFTFGVGDDVNASMLDQLAEQTRAVSSYVREHEDIEVSVSSLFNKISHPVLTDLKLTVGDKVKLSDIYPPQLPDLFHGSQLVVLGRYEGDGPATVKLSGNAGKHAKEFTFDVSFPAKTVEAKPFIEDLWARRKVGYLLDQIRLNGEQKELVDEVISLAKRHGIITPYTSYLIIPDAPVPVAGGVPAFHKNLPGGALALPKSADGKPTAVKDFAKAVQFQGGIAVNRAKIEDAKNEADLDALAKAGAGKGGGDKKDQAFKSLQEAQAKKGAYDKAGEYFAKKQLGDVQAGKLGVDLSVWCNQLRNQSQVCSSAVKRVQNRNCVEVGGIWMDEGFDPKMPTVTVKAMSKAYFRILEKHAAAKEIFQLGNHLVWVAPSGTALIIDTVTGEEDLTDAAIDALFVAPKGK